MMFRVELYMRGSNAACGQPDQKYDCAEAAEPFGSFLHIQHSEDVHSYIPADLIKRVVVIRRDN